MKSKFLFLFFGIFLIFISVNLISGFDIYLADHGTDVKNSNGILLESGNLTIEIYDAMAGGNQIYSHVFTDSIINGSWNVQISTTLEYGKIYYKDYQINGEDLDFDSNERLEFSSPLGYINNVSTINFSLINSCPAGSSIRLIYENGSVVCETDDSGNGSGSSDLTNYALKNQSETFSGNITTTDTGFFGWLGSLTSRITKLFVQDIDASGNVNVSGNVTATKFIGDGSLLTGLSSGSIYTHLSNFTDNINATSTFNSTYAGLVNNESYLSTYNLTYATWAYNQSVDLTNYYTKIQIDNNLTLYLLKTDQSFNETALLNSINTSTNIKALGFYNSSQVDNLISSSGNLSWNETRANLLYSNIQWNYNQTKMEYEYNQTIPANAYTDATNNSLASWINSNFLLSSIFNAENISIWNAINGISGDNSTWNEALARLLFPSREEVNLSITDLGLKNGFNSTYNSTYAGLINNESYLSTYNSTYNGIVLNNSYLNNETYNYNQSQDLTLYAKYQFTSNNFNGSGNFTTTGRIGIGTTDSTTKVDIYSTGTSTTLGQLDTNLRLRTGTSTANDGNEISFAGLGFNSSGLSKSIFASISAPVLANNINTGTRGYLSFSTKSAQADTTLTERMRITGDGLVNVTGNLNVVGNLSATNVVGYDGTVCASGCEYTSIATAVTTEGVGKSIFVKRGTYSETTNITIQNNQNIYFDKVLINLATEQQIDMLSTGYNATLSGDLYVAGDGYNRRLLDVRVDNVNAENLLLTISPTSGLAMIADTRQVFTWGNANRFNIKYTPFTITSPNAGYTAQIFSTISQNSTYKIEIPSVTVTGGTGTGGVTGVVVGDDYNNIEVNVKYITTATGNTGTGVNLIAGGDRNSVRGIAYGCDASNLTNSGTANNVASVVST